MERVSVSFLLLLLLCSLVEAERQDSEIKDEPESVNVPEQHQPFDSNLNAVLHKIKITLAEHRVGIDMLQTLNQEQTAKLRELEQQASEVDTLKIKQQDQAHGVNILIAEQQAQAAELGSITTQLDVTEKHVESLM